MPGCAAVRYCRKGKAQGFDLRCSRRQDTAAGLLLGGLAWAFHCGINL
jgi:hypothetical protein